MNASAPQKTDGLVLPKIEYRHERRSLMLQFFGEARAAMEGVDEVDTLFKEHWGEVAVHKDMYRMDPDFPRYMRLLEENKLAVISARLEDGKLIGYLVYIINTHIHYKNVLIANDDLYFISKAYRQHGLGSGMVRAGEAVLKRLGVKFVMMRTKANSPHIEFLEHLGYGPVDLVYGKVLEN